MRQTCSISLLGSAETLSRSRYAERCLIPAEGGLVFLAATADGSQGAGGGVCCNTDFGVGGDADGIVAACRRSSEILS